MARPVICVIGTGGTISCVADDTLDTLNYPEFNRKRDTPALLAALPDAVGRLYDLRPLSFATVNSTMIGPPEWRALAVLIEQTAAAQPDIAGFVVMHGTATLEETAYVLNLVLKLDQTVVLVGAQRPGSAVSADGPANLIAAIRTAAAPEARDAGVLVVMNDEIHAARDVTKCSTYRLNTFRSPETGPLGVVDGDGVHMLHRPTKLHTQASLFGIRALDAPPRVDIAYSHAGNDGTAVHAFLAAGACGIVSAGMLPGMVSAKEWTALAAARQAGCMVVQSVRGGSGRVAPRRGLRDAGFVAADSLNPHKARILLMLALTVTGDTGEIQARFDTH
jgi:L-asparaginase